LTILARRTKLIFFGILPAETFYLCINYFCTPMKSTRLKVGITALFVSISASIVASELYYFIRFADKKGTPYSLLRPEEFLSVRAIERRKLFGVGIDSTDLPVNPLYINEVIATGVQFHSSSKWLNGITILSSDSFPLQAIKQLPFVKNIQYTGIRTSAVSVRQHARYNYTLSDYGSSEAQIRQLNGQFLHDKGYRGKGVLIGILDSGFRNVDTNPAFDSLRIANRITGAASVISSAIDVYRQDAHGALVLSVMAANIPGRYIGTAPEASYLLLQTEYAPNEYLVETDFWVRGIELADSAGADVVNSSLGYTEFDDPAMNFTYADMNGRVARSSIAAEMAAQKGMIVCNSVGNSGSLPWKYLGSPADAHAILSIGATTSTGEASAFSSYGPSSDGRVKPELSATGTRTALVNTQGSITSSNGTSFSSPVVAGMAACYLQFLRRQHQSLSVGSIINQLIQSANRAATPHPQLGYGIPDFAKVPGLITGNAATTTDSPITFSFNPAAKTITVGLTALRGIDISVHDLSGRRLMHLAAGNSFTELNLSNLNAGVYLVQVRAGKELFNHKILLR